MVWQNKLNLIYILCIYFYMNAVKLLTACQCSPLHLPVGLFNPHMVHQHYTSFCILRELVFL